MSDETRTAEANATSEESLEAVYNVAEQNEKHEAEEAAAKKKKKKSVSNKDRKNADPQADLSYDELNRIMEKRRVFALDQEARNRVYYDEASVSYAGDDLRAESVNDLIKKEFVALQASAKADNPHIVDVEITGFLSTENVKIPMLTAKLADSRGYFQIRIPLAFFTFINWKEYEGDDGKRLLNSLMGYFVGARVKCIIFELNEEKRLAYGNRVQALDLLGHYNYRKENSRTGKPNVTVGTVVDGTIIGHARDRIWVDCCGADVIIKSREIDWNMPGHLNELEEFDIGRKIRVKITAVQSEKEVKIGPRTYHMQLVQASRRILLTNPAELFFDRFSVGEIVRARITSENKDIGIFVLLNEQMSCLCGQLSEDYPLGSECYVRIEAKYEDNKMIRGRILQDTIRPPRRRFN